MIGFRVEKWIGTKKIMIIYLAAGIGGNLLSSVVSPHEPAVGASTSGFGLIHV